MICSVLIANDATETHRRKEGDVVCIAASDHTFGTEENKRYLVVKVDFEDVFSDECCASFKLCVLNYVENVKNQFQIAFATIDGLVGGIDWDRVRDEADNYQPLPEINCANVIYNKDTSSLMSKADLEAL